MSKQWPDKTIIGLTGNIATGKSAIMQMAATEGALTLDADQVVHEILENDASMQAAIAVAFGADVRRPDGTIDRPALAAIVFSDEEALQDLERMLHPAVRQRIYEDIEATPASVVMIEAIKLLEGGLRAIVDQVWVARAPTRVQIERLMVCRGMDAETAVMRVNAQNPQEAKVARADVVIDTDSTLAHTRSQFELAWSRLSTAVGATAPAGRAPQPPRRRVPSRVGVRKERKQALAPARPEPDAQTAPAEQPARPDAAPGPEIADDVIVRRARPSDIPGILLLIRKATDGEIQMTRTDLLMAFSERSYLIGQQDAEIKMVVGWNTSSTTAVAIDQIYVDPLPAINVIGPAVLQEIEASARQLICEVALAYLRPDTQQPIRQLFLDAGYQPRERADMPRAWQETVAETQPENTFILAKVLRDIRIQ